MIIFLALKPTCQFVLRVYGTQCNTAAGSGKNSITQKAFSSSGSKHNYIFRLRVLYFFFYYCKKNNLLNTFYRIPHKKTPPDGRSMACSRAFDHGLHDFKDSKRGFNLTFNGTFLGTVYKSYLNSPHNSSLKDRHRKACFRFHDTKLSSNHWGTLGTDY